MANIAVICDREFFRPFDQRVYKEVITMKKAGHEVEIITPHDSNMMKEIEGIPVHCVTTNGPPVSTAYRLIKRAIAKDYDIYYCHEFDPLLYSLVLRWLKNKPIIWDCHEYLAPMKMELQGKLAYVFTKIAIAITAPKVHHIITVDNRLAKSLSKFGKVTVIPNYPSMKEFDIPLSKEKNEKPTALYVGSLTERRGIKIMLESIRKVREKQDVRLRVAGGFYDPKLEKWAKDFDQKHQLQVEWLGWVDYRALAPVVRDSDFGIFLNQPGPRYLKGLPTKIFEYMIMGLPVVSATGPLLDALINNNNIGITVDSTNSNDVALGIEKLLSKNSLSEIGEIGRKMVTESYCWEAKENKLLGIIDKLTS